MDKGMLHGKTPDGSVSMDVNKVDAAGDMGESVRKAEVLDYITAGDVASETSAFKSANPEVIDLPSPDALYPTA